MEQKINGEWSHLYKGNSWHVCIRSNFSLNVRFKDMTQKANATRVSQTIDEKLRTPTKELNRQAIVQLKTRNPMVPISEGFHSDERMKIDKLCAMRFSCLFFA